MGMFDYIRYVMDCPKCGAEMDSFQSKDGDCCLSTLEFWEVNNFYDSCDKCEAWVEFDLKHREKRGIEDYKMTVEGK